MKHLFQYDHSPFFVNGSTNFQPKHEVRPPPTLKHDFATFACKKANWNGINQLKFDHTFDTYCKSIVDVKVHLRYDWIFKIL